MSRLARLALALCAAAISATAGAASATDNLLAASNVSFDSGVTGWVAAPGDAAVGHEPSEGRSRAGALRADGGPNGSIVVSGPCIAARPGAYEIAGSIKTASGTPYYCGLDIYQYADVSCEQETGPVVSAARPPRGEWQDVAATGMTDGEARSLRVRFVCSGKPAFVVLLDDVHLARR